MTTEEIILKLPYQKPFLFVDEILEITSDHIKGCYKLKAEEYFYHGHFKDNPVTPGVILTEIMAQIGLMSFGVYLCKEESNDLEEMKVAMTNTAIDFYKPVYPEETVMVVAKKVYFRFNKLKCDIQLLQKNTNILIARGTISGMLLS